MQQQARIKDVEFYNMWDGKHAKGIMLEHPKAGLPNGGREFYIGGIAYTSRVVKVHENGDFETVNTYYRVEKE